MSAGHTQITAGQQIRQRAAAGISSFAHSGGIEAVAGQGLVNVQAHQGNIHLSASDSIVLTAGVKVVIQAPEVQVISQGTQTQWSGGSIVEQASHAFVVRAASFAQSSGGGGVPAGVNMPGSTLKTDEQFVLFNQQNGEPIANRRYRATLDDGQVIEGRSDAQGRTTLTNADAFRQIELIIFPPGQ